MITILLGKKIFYYNNIIMILIRSFKNSGRQQTTKMDAKMTLGKILFQGVASYISAKC